jgi:pSer/pThr/pTyr-binding forkhead associated (FHA) protein/predicted Ser/Thr protein kinase
MAGEQLRVTEGNERGKRVSVEADLFIGRESPHDDGKLGGDREISRRHARLSRGPDGLLTIEDLRSANGTFVNGERIDAPRPLGVGDVVRMGQTVLEVTDASGAVPAASGAAPSAGQELVVTTGGAPGRRLTLEDELVIGRAVSGEGRLDEDREVSRQHARVSRDPSGRLTIEDLGSANGTFVNGRRISDRQVLEAGDSVRIGTTTMEVSGSARAPAAVPSPPPAPAASPPPAPARPPRAPARPPRPAPPPARRPAATPRAPTPPPPAAPTGDRPGLGAELGAGSVFAGCRVEEVIGHGDMGVVYQAEELALQRRVALKLILPEHSREERFRERFRRESRVAAAIDHPNVIPILDAGDEEGVLYITMRLVEGTDLRALIAAEGRIDPLRASRIVGQVGAALDAAHARGLLHRDVKPPNVLLARRDHVYLTDFGLAKRAESVSALTRQGSIVARAEYVAPEQILNERVDARADIYSLGCLLFEAVTGEAPFARWKEGPAQLAHLNAPVPSPRELRPDLPPEFDEVIGRAMAKDPDDRYPSAGDLGQAALVAAGGMRRASEWSVVATGEAAPFGPGAPAAMPAPSDQQAAQEPTAGHPVQEPASGAYADGGEAGPDTLRWAIALAALALVAVGMVAALSAISTL